jgi:hypothetical protein
MAVSRQRRQAENSRKLSRFRRADVAVQAFRASSRSYEVKTAREVLRLPAVCQQGMADCTKEKLWKRTVRHGEKDMYGRMKGRASRKGTVLAVTKARLDC